MSERAEDFITTAQGRDNVTRARLALDADGRFLALDVSTVANLGAYLSSGGPGSSTNAPANAMGSGYVIPAIFMDVHGVFTNTVPIDAYRGAGKPEVNYMIERLIDEAARRCGFDAIDLRRRNLVIRISLPQGAWHGDRLRPVRRQYRRCGSSRQTTRISPCARRCGEAARHAARHRHHLLHGDRTRRTERRRGNPLRRRWPGDIAGRHTVQRHGSRDRLCADRRRPARVCRSRPSATCRRIRARCAPATAMAARVPCTWAALRCARRWTRCWQRGARSPRDCCRRRSNRSYSPRVALPCAARRIAPSICWRSHVPHAIRQICRTAWPQTWTPMSGTCSTSSPSPTAATSPKWRSIRTPAPSRSSATPRWTISAR